MDRVTTIGNLIKIMCDFAETQKVDLRCISFNDGKAADKCSLKDGSLDSQLSFLYGDKIFTRTLKRTQTKTGKSTDPREIFLFSRYENHSFDKRSQGWKNVETTLDKLASGGKFEGDQWYKVHRATIIETIIKQITPKICLMVEQFKERFFNSIQGQTDDFKNSFVGDMAEYLCSELKIQKLGNDDINVDIKDVKHPIDIIAIIAIDALISIEIIKSNDPKVTEDIRSLKTCQNMCWSQINEFLKKSNQDFSASQTLGDEIVVENAITQQTQNANRIISIENVSTFSDLKHIDLGSWRTIIDSVLLGENPDVFFEKVKKAQWRTVIKRLGNSTVYQNLVGRLYMQDPESRISALKEKMRVNPELSKTKNKMSYLPLEECRIHQYIIRKIIREIPFAPDYKPIGDFFDRLLAIYGNLGKRICTELEEIGSDDEGSTGFLNFREWQEAEEIDRTIETMEQFNHYMTLLEKHMETDLDFQNEVYNDIERMVSQIGGDCSVITWLLLKRIAIMDKTRSIMPGNERYEEFFDIMRSYYRDQLQSIAGDPIGIIANEPEDAKLRDIISSTSKHDI